MTLTSLLTVTEVVTVELSLAGLVSIVVVVTDAVLEMLPVAELAILTMRVKVAEAPGASEAQLHVTVPPEPTAGLVQEAAGPVFCCWEMNVVLAGSASVSCALAAGDAPLFVTVMV